MMKRHRNLSSSDSSDNESPSTSVFNCSNYLSKSKTPSNDQKKPAEVFRKDLISAMKIPDSHHVNLDEYYPFADSWKQEWEKGVQVPASPETIPNASLRVVAEKEKQILFSRPRKFIHCSSQEPVDPGYINILELAERVCRYDLDEVDIFWLQELNLELFEMGCSHVDEGTMEKTVEVLERHCHENMNHAIETEEGLGIEYDEDVICDVCQSPDSEEGNDMVFCDRCNICVHQACYGILKVPEGSWLCKTCVLGLSPQCILCPKAGGAMKATRTGTKWAHVSCALWIPEVSIACPERMEPITKVSHIPPSRWALVCSLCKLKTGACIQCSVKSCITPFHVTCAFEHSLEMKTVLDEGDEVKFKSHCLKHSRNKQGSLPETEQTCKSPINHKQTDMEKTSLRDQKLRALEEEFYTLVKIDDVATELGLPRLVVDFIFKYWKLKRKSNFNKPLLPPKEDEETGLRQPKEDSIHTRMRMFMHLRQDLERVRNLCYMVSRREKLKLSHSKLHEQIFNLQVQLVNQELTTGHLLSSALEKTLFYPPPRITLKLKMPKATLGNTKNNSKTKVDRTFSLEKPSSGIVLGKKGPRTLESAELKKKSYSRHYHEKRSNGLVGKARLAKKGLQDSGPTQDSNFHVHQALGKPLALQAVLHGQSSNGNGKINQENIRFTKCNGVASRPIDVPQRDCVSQVSREQELVLTSHLASQSSAKKSTIEHFSRSFKEACNSLSRTAVDLQSCGKSQGRLPTKEHNWSKQTEYPATGANYQDNDGYCPDVEFTDSEAESDENKEQNQLIRNGSDRESPVKDFGRDCHSKSKRKVPSHNSLQR